MKSALTSSVTASGPLFSSSLVRTSNGWTLRKTSTVPGRHRHAAAVRAVISSDDKSVSTATPLQVAVPGDGRGRFDGGEGAVDVRVVLTIRNKSRDKLTEKLEEHWIKFVNGTGKGITVQLVGEEIDPATKKGKRSKVEAVRGWLPKPSYEPDIDEYAANLSVPSNFGRPGAIIITNLHDKEFFLTEVVVHGFAGGPVFFPENTWIHSHKDNPESRVLFSNRAYLPSQTPDGIKDLRQQHLVSHHGNRKGQRKKFERIYDYDTYNDLGDPDEDDDLSRPTLGGREHLYPRRCRTGRPPAKKDPTAESRLKPSDTVYVPRDETFEEIKQATFSAGKLKAVLHNLIPVLRDKLSGSDRQFQYFNDIDELYREGVLVNRDETETKITDRLLLPAVLKGMMGVPDKLLKYEIPSIVSKDRFSWLRDNEFARQTLAGVNPVSIERLREFPIRSKLDPAIYGPPESALTKEVIERELDGMRLEEAMENNRLYILDYHDLLLPNVKRINSLKDRKLYASRTIIFLTDSGILRPIAIELSLSPTPSNPSRKKVYTHGHDATTQWIWKWAKAHVCAVDAGVHQLVNHWLRTHACMEPYIIAAHRQLSVMHPVFKLLSPHMRYTMEINALARHSLINGGGVIEQCFTPGKYSLELSSAAYKSSWRFDMEALPADLLRRGMAVEDPSMPCGIKLVIEDYPYAADGLLVWQAIEDWVRVYVNHFYEDPDSVLSDVELQAWWDEIKNKGHEDKKNEPWWPKLNTREDLMGILTTMIWTASGQHAAINFGQYPFGGYMPNRPTLMKKLIPHEDEPGYLEFMKHPEYVFLSTLPSQLEATKVMAVQDTLSTHSPDEEYLGQESESYEKWIDDPKIRAMLDRFSMRLQEIEEVINKRNNDFSLKNRCGAGVPPYELLLPTSGPGVTARGIPNSISI